MTTVLVTGANGFVGRHLVKELSDNGMKVIGVGGGHDTTEQLPGCDQFMILDLMDQAAVAKVDFSGIDAVVHLAGLAAPGPSFDDPMLYLTTNMGIEVNLFETALAQGAKPRWLIISSGNLYDARAPLPLTEDSPVLPSSPYAVSKIAQEQMTHYYSSRGLECIVARPFNHIGPGQALGFLVPDLAEQIIAAERDSRQEILVGNLDTKRDYTDVRDIVRAYRLLLEKGQAGETYNICSGKAISGHEILEGLQAASSKKLVAKQDDTKFRPSDNPELYGSHDKITADTGWQPEISLETTLQDVIDDWRSQAS